MSLFDLSSVVNLLSANTATVSRFSADTIASTGRANARIVQKTFSIKCSFQPIAGVEKTLEEGAVRPSETASIWTTSELMIRDRVLVTGRGTYEVYDVSIWPDYGNYYKALARKVATGEPRP